MEIVRKFFAWWGRWWHTVLTIAGTILAFVGAYWGSYSGDDETPLKIWTFEIPWQFVGFGVGLIGVAMASVLPIRETRVRNAQISTLQDKVDQAVADTAVQVDKAKVDGRAEFLFVLDFVLLPLLRKLGTLTQTAARSQARKTIATEIRMLSLTALKEVIDPSIPRLRANFYKLEYSANGDPYLVLAAYIASPPRERFDLSVPGEEADALLDMLATGGYVFTEDCVLNPPKGFDGTRPRSYKTFISASATDGSDVIGMVTVDSPESGSLKENDAVLVSLIATIVAIAEAVATGKRDFP